MIGVKYLAIAAATALVAIGAAAPFVNLPTKAMGNKSLASSPDVTSVLHKRSPEQRQSGALANKGPRVSMMLPTAVTPAKVPIPARVAAPAAFAVSPESVPMPVAQAPVAMPLAFVPAVAPLVPATVVPAAAGSSFFIPPVVLPSGGGGGGGLTIAANPPGGGGAPPSAVPGVPEPGTWAMMIVGFGLLGAMLRRRRRFGESVAQVPGDGALGAGASQQA